MSKLPARPASDELVRTANELILLFTHTPLHKFEPMRQEILKHALTMCPPLTLADFLGCVVTKSYHSLWSRRHPPNRVISNQDTLVLEQVALEYVIGAVPDLAVKAGLTTELHLPLPARIRDSLGRYMKWVRAEADPALLGLARQNFSVDLNKREDFLAITLLVAMSGSDIRFQGAYLRRLLHKALVNLGWRQRGDPALTGDEYLYFMKLFVDQPLARGDLMFRGRDGRDRLGLRQLTRELGRALQSKDAPVSPLRPETELASGDMHDISRETATVSDEVLAALAVRDFQDRLDRHPAVRRLCQESRLRRADQLDLVDQLRWILDLLDRHDDPARKAAIVYTWAGKSLGSVAGGRKRLATAYGVSEKQLRDRETVARDDLAALARRTG